MYIDSDQYSDEYTAVTSIFYCIKYVFLNDIRSSTLPFVYYRPKNVVEYSQLKKLTIIVKFRCFNFKLKL